MRFALVRGNRLAALLHVGAALGAFLVSCSQGPWDCAPFGASRRCVERGGPPVPGRPWQCHEANGREICVAGAGTPALALPWSCDAAGEDVICSRGVSGYPDASSKPGWRCRREGDGARVCVPRDFGNAPWRCDAHACTRAYPDYPNEHEWECYDTGGRVLCRSLEVGPTDPAWACGVVRDHQVCADPDPDMPDAPGEWTCRYHGKDGARQCRPADGPSHCQSDRDCGRGACFNRTCLRPLLAECFMNDDCRNGRCVGGVCARP